MQNKIDNLIPVFEKEVENISYTIIKIYSGMLKDIITRENIDAIFSAKFKNEIGDVDEFTEIRGSEYFDLLKYLIRNGFIDETYSDYMTYFYEDSISAHDKIFLRRITDIHTKTSKISKTFASGNSLTVEPEPKAKGDTLGRLCIRKVNFRK